MVVKGRHGASVGASVKRKRRAAPKREKTLSIIGAGRLGTALARALAYHGYAVEAVVARSLPHAQASARLISGSPRALTPSQLEEVPSSDILFITTPDDAIAEVSARLAAILKKGRKRQTVLHTSGALSSSVLQSLRDAGFHTGSLHPLVSVSDPVDGAESLRAAFFCVEGDSGAARVAREIVRALGAESFTIEKKRKALYHAAAVLTSGHTVALFDIATEMLALCGPNRKRARLLLLPLLRSTLENLSKHETARALTGTFSRADAATVRGHLSALRSVDAGDALAAYTLLGRRSLQLAKESGQKPEALKEIALLLEAEGDRSGAKR